MIRILTLAMLCVALGSCTPIVEKVADSSCTAPGTPCDPSGEACCPGYRCTQTSAFEKAYCVQSERPPFIMARSGFFTGPPPQFMGMDTMPSDIFPRSTISEAGSCQPFTSCDPSAPNCCGDLVCRGLSKMDSQCVVKPKPEEYGTKKGCEYEGDNTYECLYPEDCCQGYYCQKYPVNHETIHGSKCVPVDPSFRLTRKVRWDARSVHIREDAPSCQSNFDCQQGFECSKAGKCFAEPHNSHPPTFGPHDHALSIQRRGEEIVCRSYLDCPNDYRCSHDKEGTWDGVCTAPGHHHGWLINRRDLDTLQTQEVQKKFEFPELPTSWCTQEGCPCYYTSPCEMGICDNYDDRMIGKCRKFNPGEGDNLQPGFPIDTVRCTYTACPCNKWYDHCWKGACDGVNRPGFGKCRPFSPMEEPKNNRKISEECTDVGCVCDGGNFPCKNSYCIIKGVNKYGRCRRFDSNGKMLHTRQEFDARCRTKDCPCRKQGDCLEGTCSNYNANGVGRCKVEECKTCHPKRGDAERQLYRK